VVVARCEVHYTGRLTPFWPEAVRLLVFKPDGSVLVHDDADGDKPPKGIGPLRRFADSRSAATLTCASVRECPPSEFSVRVRLNSAHHAGARTQVRQEAPAKSGSRRSQLGRNRPH
jgi:RecB family endonuclease NucS